MVTGNWIASVTKEFYAIISTIVLSTGMNCVLRLYAINQFYAIIQYAINQYRLYRYFVRNSAQNLREAVQVHGQIFFTVCTMRLYMSSRFESIGT